MTYNEYLPENERYDDSKLIGIYRVAFEIKVESDDELSVSDVAQALTAGFGDRLVAKVAELNVAKITKKAKKPLKVGDRIRIKENLEIKANIYSDDGYLYVGKGSDISEIVGENVDLKIEAGSFGYINRMLENKIEVADLDKPIATYAELDLGSINVDLVTVDVDKIERVDSEEVK